MKQKLFTLFICLVAAMGAQAQNFTAVNDEGQTIYYNITSSVEPYTVEVGSSGYSGAIVIPETVSYDGNTYSVTSIGNWAFADCIGLTEVTIPNSVTEIGEGAFNSCYGLTEVTIPNSVTEIGGYAFGGCSNLTAINVDADNLQYSSIDGVLYNKTQTELIQCPAGKSGSFIIPNSVTSIGVEAFRGCSGLTEVTIPNSVTEIGDWAFNSCSGLTEVTIPNSVTEIGWYAFNSCSGLTEVTIPNSVTEIGGYAFNSCSGLTAINVDADNLQYSSIDGVLYNKTQTELIQCPAGKSGSFIIPNSVTSIGRYAFYGCSGLTEVTIPNSVTSIGNWAFADCIGLTEVTIPNSVTEIGWWAFVGCSSLTTIVVENSTPPTLGYDVFDSSVLNTSTLYVPNGSLDDYKAAEGWKNFDNIVGVDLGTGVKEAIAGQISVFPNPVKADVFIQSDLTIEKVEVYTLNGTMLLQENNFSGKISLTNIPQGLYMVIIHTEKGTTVKRIMKE